MAHSKLKKHFAEYGFHVVEEWELLIVETEKDLSNTEIQWNNFLITCKGKNMVIHVTGYIDIEEVYKHCEFIYDNSY